MCSCLWPPRGRSWDRESLNCSANICMVCHADAQSWVLHSQGWGSLPHPWQAPPYLLWMVIYNSMDYLWPTVSGKTITSHPLFSTVCDWLHQPASSPLDCSGMTDTWSPLVPKLQGTHSRLSFLSFSLLPSLTLTSTNGYYNYNNSRHFYSNSNWNMTFT